MFKRALAFGGALAIALAVPGPVMAQDMVGEEAPDAEIKEWITGNAYGSFKDVRGKAIIVEFFATW